MRAAAQLARLPRFVRFAVVGALGFCVDSGVLYAAILLLGIGLYWGRVVSYLVAATSTWYLNRSITFPDTRSGHKTREWLRFLAYNSLGGAVNYLVYVCYLHYSSPSLAVPVIGVALGACAGLAVNYTLSRHLVFSGTGAAVPIGPPRDEAGS